MGTYIDEITNPKRRISHARHENSIPKSHEILMRYLDWLDSD